MPRFRGFVVPLLLVLLGVVPVLGGAVRAMSLINGHVTPENARFFASPFPIIVHLVAVALYAMLGALQFAPTLRRNAWHRRMGRVLLPLGLIVSLTGLWMTLFYPWPPLDAWVVYVTRLIVGAAMTIALVLGGMAIARRDYIAHGDWMTRAYALGMGAGTQVFTHLPWILTGVAMTRSSRAVAMSGGWVINAIIAEYLIWRWKQRRPQRSTAGQRATVVQPAAR